VLIIGQSSVHRTVRCTVCGTLRSRVFPGYVGYKSPDSPREAPDCLVFQPCNDYLPRRRAPTVTWSIGRSGAPHQTVWCPIEQETSQSRDSLSCLVLVLFTVRCAIGQSVAPTNRSKNCLPNRAPMTPSCLRAIKGTPRRMVHYTKNSLNILRR
jgi:hypothetical protein